MAQLFTPPQVSFSPCCVEQKLFHSAPKVKFCHMFLLFWNLNILFATGESNSVKHSHITTVPKENLKMLVPPPQCVPCHLDLLVSLRPPGDTDTKWMCLWVVESRARPSSLGFQRYFSIVFPSKSSISTFISCVPCLIASLKGPPRSIIESSPWSLTG